MIHNAVIGVGFGDEGKGKTVNYLCSKSPDPLVIRFSGGQQAGHQVYHKSKNNKSTNHVFSNFGSGTLQGIPTYWSKYCTVDPVGILNELDILLEKGISPTLYIDGDCPVTTPYDKTFNNRREESWEHGSCQVGVGQTYQREEDFYHLKLKDALFPSVFKMKLRMIRDQYYKDVDFPEDYENDFLIYVNELLDSKYVTCSNGFSKTRYSSYIFEGSQGLLLDQNYGFFPHVSRGNFGSKNILDMGFKYFPVTLVMRAYQTRHGNGPMTNEIIPHNIKPNPYEQNYDDTPQGKFRISLLDLDLIKYSISRDPYISSPQTDVELVITCLDLVEDDYRFTLDGKIQEFKNEIEFVSAIQFELFQIKNVYISRTPYSEMEKIK